MKALSALEQAYPDDPAQGSPFNTGTAFNIYGQYKRIAAFQGDYVFQAPRRFFSTIASKTQKIWAFRYLRGSFGQFGVTHSSDVGFFYNTANNTNSIGVDALIYFTANLNPIPPPTSSSALANFSWPLWSSSATNPPLLTFIDAEPYANVTSDTYRAAPMKVLQSLALGQIGFGV